MSICVVFIRVPAEVLAETIGNHDLVRPLIRQYSEQDSQGHDEGNPSPSAYLDIDKSWHGIWFLLDAAGCQGKEVTYGGGTSYVAYDDDPWEHRPDLLPASYFTPEEVANLADLLGEHPFRQLATYYDAATMMEDGIYGPDWDRDPDEGLTYLRLWYEQLVEFLARAASEGEAIITMPL
ncbi:MAG: YfbM family protein [Streptosporangiaceae bacterium]